MKKTFIALVCKILASGARNGNFKIAFGMNF